MLTSLQNLLIFPYPIENTDEYAAAAVQMISDSYSHQLMDEISDLPSLIFGFILQSNAKFGEFLENRELTEIEQEGLSWLLENYPITPGSFNSIEFVYTRLLPLNHLLLESLVYSFKLPLSAMVDAINTLHIALVARKAFDAGETDKVEVKIKCAKSSCANTEFGGLALGATFCLDHIDEAKNLVSDLGSTLSAAVDTLGRVREHVEGEISQLESESTKRSRFFRRR